MAKDREAKEAKSEPRKKRGFRPPRIVYILLAVALIAVGFMGSQMWNNAREPHVRVDTTTVTSQLVRCQKLVTAKLEYRGLVKYEEGDIDLINKKGFSMIYDATVSASVDLKKAKASVNDRTIKIELPSAERESVSIDPDSLEFYDEKRALFNWQNRADTAKALEYAKKDAEEKIKKGDLIEKADEQAVSAIKTLFSPLTEDGAYKLEVTIAED